MRHVFAFDAIQFLRGEFLKCFSNLKRKEKERKDCKEVTTDFLYESTIRKKKKKTTSKAWYVRLIEHARYVPYILSYIYSIKA